MKKIFTTILALACMSAPWAVRAQTTVTFSFSQDPELFADAGADTNVCDTILAGVMLDGSGTGGDGAYAYSWTPTTDLSDATIANPVATPPSTTTYTLMVSDGNNCTASDDMVLTVDTCLVGITNLEGVASVSLYPNPNKGTFRVNANLQKRVENFTLTVVTVSGQKVYSNSRTTPASSFVEEVNLPNIAKGVYMVKMDFDGAILERKIIVQ